MSLLPLPPLSISISVTRADGTTLDLHGRQIAAVLDALKVDEDTRVVRDFIVGTGRQR